MMLWLPLYLYETMDSTDHQIANVESLYEVGVLIGVIAIGIISDRTVSARRAPVAILWVTTAFIISIVFVSFKL